MSIDKDDLHDGFYCLLTVALGACVGDAIQQGHHLWAGALGVVVLHSVFSRHRKEQRDWLIAVMKTFARQQGREEKSHES